MNKGSPLAGLEDRCSGVLLHVTSLPGPVGHGDLGSCAHSFVDFLAKAGQSFWQTLPVNPIGLGNSPYSTIASLACEPMLIDLEDLAHQGLLNRSDVPTGSGSHGARSSFAQARKIRWPRLRKAYAIFEPDADYARFVKENRFWLADYALFHALSDHYGTMDWTTWPTAVRRREKDTLASIAQELSDEIGFHRFVQYQFDRQWHRLRRHAHAQGVSLMGDLPIFVGLQSADVWAHQELFWLKSNGKPSFLSGVPPDYFNPDGQLWGHALYRWDRMEEDRFRWWVERFRCLLRKYDAIRLDHFIGFHRYWRIPASSGSPKEGRWFEVPGRALFERVTRVLGEIPLIAEDLGSVTPEVWDLRDHFRFPGIRVAQFGFGNNDDADYHRPYNFPERSVAYTGTHDNDTTNGWWRAICRRDPTQRPTGYQGKETGPMVRRYLGPQKEPVHWSLIRAVASSHANVSMIPAQDLLGLGSQCRMNIPGVPDGNWTWRVKPKQLTSTLAQQLHDMTAAYGRLPKTREAKTLS